MSWIVEHWDKIGDWLALLVTVCTGVAGLTPTKKDDGVVANIVKFADMFSIVNTRKDRAILKEAKEKE